jgi:hypothetical protein
MRLLSARGEHTWTTKYRNTLRRNAPLLLGIPEEELSRISSESELGHTERTGNQKEIFDMVFVSSKLADFRLGGL